MGQERCSLSFYPKKATLLFFPSIWARRESCKSSIRECSSEKQTNVGYPSPFGGQWACPVTSRWGSIVSVIPPGSASVYHSLHLLSPDPEDGCLCCAGIAGCFLVGLCPWRVWYTVVCWKVLASKGKGLRWKTNQNMWLPFFLWWRQQGGGILSSLAASHKMKPF